MQQGNVSAIATDLPPSEKRRLLRCHTCATHFAETRETVFFDLRTSEDKVMMALKMLLGRVDLAGIGLGLGVTGVNRVGLAQACRLPGGSNQSTPAAGPAGDPGATRRDVERPRLRASTLVRRTRQAQACPQARTGSNGCRAAWPLSFG